MLTSPEGIKGIRGIGGIRGIDTLNLILPVHMWMTKMGVQSMTYIDVSKTPQLTLYMILDEVVEMVSDSGGRSWKVSSWGVL